MKPEPSADSFVLDENLSQALAQALQLLDDQATVRHITDFFDKGTEDTVFLPVLGRRGAFLITRDTRQRKRPAELDAYRRHRVGAFILAGKSLQRWDLVKQLVLAWPQIKDIAGKANRPFAYRVRAAAGRLEPLSL